MELHIGTGGELRATRSRTCQTKSFLFSGLTTQPRGLNFCLSFSRTLDRSPSARTRIIYGVPSLARTAHSRRSRRESIAHPRGARRFSYRAHAAALSHARAARTHTVSAHRSGARRNDARTFSSSHHQ